MLKVSAIITIAYLLGSIPSSIWIGKTLFKTDVRKSGSGSMGATNAMRVLGLKVAIPVLLLDMIKGYVAVKSVHLFFDVGDTYFMQFQMMAGITAAIGHIFPVFAGFRGGKGVATLTAVLLAVTPQLLLVCFPVFLITVAISRYVSLGSMISTAVIPFVYYFILQKTEPYYIGFSILLLAIVLLTHRANIARLIHGKENAFTFKRKK